MYTFGELKEKAALCTNSNTHFLFMLSRSIYCIWMYTRSQEHENSMKMNRVIEIRFACRLRGNLEEMIFCRLALPSSSFQEFVKLLIWISLSNWPTNISVVKLKCVYIYICICRNIYIWVPSKILMTRRLFCFGECHQKFVQNKSLEKSHLVYVFVLYSYIHSTT